MKNIKSALNNFYFLFTTFGILLFLILLSVSFSLNNWTYLSTFVLFFPFSFFSFYIIDISIYKKKIGNKFFYFFIFIFEKLVLVLPLLVTIIISIFFNLNEIFNIWIVLVSLLIIPLLSFLKRSIFLRKKFR